MNDIKHLAMIMDGNVRWAAANGRKSYDGHKCGAENIKKLLPVIIDYKIPYITLYAFSSENWDRPQKEVSFLVHLLDNYLCNEIDKFNKDGIKLKIIGDTSRLHNRIKQNISNAIELTQNNDKLTLSIAFGYGGRIEIVDACNKIIKSKLPSISIETFNKYLYDPNMPDVDLLIRTGNVFRISNFLLWQCAYAELFFSTKYWPDFSADDLVIILSEYSNRKRTFGIR